MPRAHAALFAPAIRRLAACNEHRAILVVGTCIKLHRFLLQNGAFWERSPPPHVATCCEIHFVRLLRAPLGELRRTRLSKYFGGLAPLVEPPLGAESSPVPKGGGKYPSGIFWLLQRDLPRPSWSAFQLNDRSNELQRANGVDHAALLV